MRGENLVAHLDGLGGTPVAHHCSRAMSDQISVDVTTFRVPYAYVCRLIFPDRWNVASSENKMHGRKPGSTSIRCSMSIANSFDVAYLPASAPLGRLLRTLYNVYVVRTVPWTLEGYIQSGFSDTHGEFVRPSRRTHAFFQIVCEHSLSP
jgi:hypothetical protein